MNLERVRFRHAAVSVLISVSQIVQYIRIYIEYSTKWQRENRMQLEETFNLDYFTFHLCRKIFTRLPRGPIDLS